MTISTKRLIIGMVIIAFCSGCATTGEQSSGPSKAKGVGCFAAYTIGGAAIGAGIGALLGGGKTGGIIAGGAAGAALGLAMAWGHCLEYFTSKTSESVKDYASTATETSYNPAQGKVIDIKSFTLSPDAVKPGDTATFEANYTVMAPSDQTDIKVTETYSLNAYDEKTKQYVKVGEVPEEKTISAGTRKTTINFQIPDDMAKSKTTKYKVIFSVSSGDKSSSVEKPLTIIL